MHRMTITAIAFALMATASTADDITLPPTMNITAYPTGSLGYTQAVAFGNVLQSKHGTSLRVLPGQNDVARLVPLKTNRAEICICGIATYYAAEGTGDFASPDWGPQRYRMIGAGYGALGMGLVVAGDSDIDTVADVKGKRVAYVVGSDSQNTMTEAYLAFADLTWDDVEKVEFPGTLQASDALSAGQVDAMPGATVRAPMYLKIQSSRRGIHYPPMPEADTKGWNRVRDVAPFLAPVTITDGVDMTPEKPWEGGGYPYPLMVTRPELDADTAFNLIKFIADDFDSLEDLAPGMFGWAMERQRFDGVFPYHEGVVKYFKEVGMWTDAAQEHQDMLLKRQDVLATAWEDFLATNPDKGESFAANWLSARGAALEAAQLSK